MNKFIKVVTSSVIFFISQQANAITINLDYTYDSNNFFNTQAKKNVLNDAASFFENRINDSLSAINSSGNNQFNISFRSPSDGVITPLSNVDIAANTLVVYAGGRNLSGTTVGLGGPGGFSSSGSTAFNDLVATRGQGDGTRTSVKGSSAFDFGPWGGAITFDADSVWYFDQDVSSIESFSGNDFYSVAVHELGHLLGIGTSDSWDNLVSGGVFTGSASTTVKNGNVVLDSDESHWQNGTMSLVDGLATQEVAMDPSILRGSRKNFTDLDLAGLTDVGWEVTAVPVPAAIYLFGSALFSLGAFRKQVKTA